MNAWEPSARVKEKSCQCGNGWFGGNGDDEFGGMDEMGIDEKTDGETLRMRMLVLVGGMVGGGWRVGQWASQMVRQMNVNVDDNDDN